MKRMILGLAAAVALALMTGCPADKPEPTPEEATVVHVGDPAPLFEGLLLDGTPFDLEANRGRVVLLSFFATWCPPCREEMPHLENEVWKRFRDRNFAMVAIAREHEPEDLDSFVTELGITFPILPDPDRSVYSRFAEAYIPRTVVVDPEGTVVYHGTDFDPDEFSKMVGLIDETLAASGDSGAPGAETESEAESVSGR